MSKLENELHFIYSHVNEMLKFGEAKNAGLIVLNLTAIIGILQIELQELGTFFQYLCYYTVILNFISIFFCLAGIFAQLRVHEKKPVVSPNENLLYFGTIAQLTPADFYQRIVDEYGMESVNEKFEKDLCKQIVIVSQITLRKFRLFNIAMLFTLASLPPSILCYWLFNRFLNPNLR